MKPIFRLIALASVSTTLLCSCGPPNDLSQPLDRDPREVPFVTTPQTVVDRMLETAAPAKDDLILDLGCGDGRIVVSAAKKYGCRGIGYDIDPKLIELCRENARRAGVEHLVEFRQEDIYQAELPREATVITLYLLPEMNLRLLPWLQSLDDGRKVISFRWIMPGVKEEKKITMETGEKMLPMGDIHFFTTPLLVDPDWKPREKTPIEVDFNKIREQLKFAERKALNREKKEKKQDIGQEKPQGQ
ncbi:MAG: class I SAM-dependent methyltransferase [Planctomycetota bacterium]|nr:class I SAM-dependent methyltransferase [Planctomycetota bacterium]